MRSPELRAIVLFLRAAPEPDVRCLLASRAVRLVSRAQPGFAEEFCHVAILSEWWVYDPSLLGPVFVDAFEYVSRVGAIYAGVEVPIARHLMPPMERISLWRTALRWLSRGRLPASDCVSQVAWMLRQGGVHVPRTIVTPGQLWRHLEQAKYPSAAL